MNKKEKYDNKKYLCSHNQQLTSLMFFSFTAVLDILTKQRNTGLNYFKSKILIHPKSNQKENIGWKIYLQEKFDIYNWQISSKQGS